MDGAAWLFARAGEHLPLWAMFALLPLAVLLALRPYIGIMLASRARRRRWREEPEDT